MKIGYIMQEGGPDVRQRPLKGPANHVFQIFMELKKLGHHIRLVVQYDGRIWKSDNLEDFEPIIVRRFDQGLMRRVESIVRGIQSRLGLPYANFFESLRFSEACQQELSDRDIFYERMGWMGYGGGLAAQKLGIPLILEANNGDFITELERRGIAPKGVQRWLAIALMRKSVHRAAHIIATGDGHRDRFIDWWRVASSSVSVIENGSEIVSLLDREQLQPFSSDGEKKEQITVVWVGTFDPWQGVKVLIPAFAQAQRKISSLKLVLIGSGPEWEDVKEDVHRRGLEEKVTLTGRLNIHQVTELLATADIGVAPYCGWMEYSGLKLFDYKSAGLAIIASGQNGQPATIKHGTTGLIVPPCAENDLCEAICQLAEDMELRRNMGRTARIEAEELHGWDHTTALLEKTFTQVLGI